MSENKKSHNFLFGLVTGIAAMALVGLLTIIISSPFNIGEGNAKPNQVVDTEFKDPSPTIPTPKAPAAKVDIEIKDDDHIRGYKNAPITIVEYSDFQCPYCSKFHTTMNKVIKDYPNKVRWVYKHFPLDFHPYAIKAAEASECAADQNKFWEYNDALFTEQADIDNDIFGKIAKDLGLNTNKFNECLDSGKYTDKVEADYQSGVEIGVSGTPGSFINGNSLGGALPYEDLKLEIEELL